VGSEIRSAEESLDRAMRIRSVPSLSGDPQLDFHVLRLLLRIKSEEVDPAEIEPEHCRHGRVQN
jgi:hypothetical protein